METLWDPVFPGLYILEIASLLGLPELRSSGTMLTGCSDGTESDIPKELSTWRSAFLIVVFRMVLFTQSELVDDALGVPCKSCEQLDGPSPSEVE